MNATWTEQPLQLECAGSRMLGMLTSPAASKPVAAVVIVVGGPQYRAGSHRQFVQLARSLAQAGIASLRFDLRGMGDSEGVPVAFDDADDDLRSAIGALLQAVPALRSVALWGLCDGATACALYPEDARVAGIVLVNPWVRTEQIAARARIEGYYGRRFTDARFWRKLLRGRVDIAGSLKGVVAAWRGSRSASEAPVSPAASRAPWPRRFVAGLARSPNAMIALSGRDVVADEFRAMAAEDAALAAALRAPSVRVLDFPAANHTFSTGRTHDELAAATIAWLQELVASRTARETAGPPLVSEAS